MKIILSSSSDRNIEFNYRLPNGQMNTVCVPAYAINNEYTFPSEELYESFKRQNIIYFTGDDPILSEGRATASGLERTFNSREKANAKKITTSAKAAADHVANATQDSGVKISIDVDAVGESK